MSRRPSNAPAPGPPQDPLFPDGPMPDSPATDATLDGPAPPPARQYAFLLNVDRPDGAGTTTIGCFRTLGAAQESLGYLPGSDRPEIEAVPVHRTATEWRAETGR